MRERARARRALDGAAAPIGSRRSRLAPEREKEVRIRVAVVALRLLLLRDLLVCPPQAGRCTFAARRLRHARARKRRRAQRARRSHRERWAARAARARRTRWARRARRADRRASARAPTPTPAATAARGIWFGARGARGCCTAGRPRAVHLGLRQDVQEKNNGSRHSKRFMDHVFSPKPGDGGVLKVHIVSSSRYCLWLGAALSPRGRCTAPRAGQRSPFSTLSKTRKDAAWRSAASAPRRRVRRRTSTTGPVPSGAGGVRLRGLQREARQHPRLREADGPIWARDRTALGGAHAEPAVGRLGRRRHRYNRPAAARSWHRRCATRRDSHSVCALWRVRAIEYI